MTNKKEGGSRPSNKHTAKPNEATTGDREQELVDAVEYLSRLISQSGIEHVRTTNFPTIGRNSFYALINGNESITDWSPERQRNILEFYQKRETGLPPQTKLYRVINEAMNIDGTLQNALSKYVGKYTSFRFDDSPGSLLVGTIQIEYRKSTGGFWFTHNSTQVLHDGIAEVFDHEGPAYMMGRGRFYLVGIGTDAYGGYIRPMILQDVGNPQLRPIVGLVTTETYYAVPISCRTVLLHSECETRLRKTFATDDEFKKHIETLLGNRCRVDGILNGWKQP